jgi:hypothetical protein
VALGAVNTVFMMDALKLAPVVNGTGMVNLIVGMSDD